MNARTLIGAQLREARLHAGFSMAEMAEALGVRYQTYLKYERGHRQPSDEKAYEAARKLGCDVSAFSIPKEPQEAVA